MGIRIFWGLRRRDTKNGAAAAMRIKQQEQAALRDSQFRRAVTERTVTEPLRRQRDRLLAENHVTEEIIRLLRGT